MLAGYVKELSSLAFEEQGCFDAVGRGAQADPLVLHGPPQALDEDVVVASPASIHADLDPVIPQHLGKLVAGELCTLIGIEDAGLAEPGKGLARRLHAEPRREPVRQRRTDAIPRPRSIFRDQRVKPSAPGRSFSSPALWYSRVELPEKDLTLS
jgi:hypothetical protein